MHQHTGIKSLVRHIEKAARAERARRVVGVSVRLGARSHMTPCHFGQHFDQAAAGTIAEDATLTVITSNDAQDPHAADVTLDGIEVEKDEEVPSAA